MSNTQNKIDNGVNVQALLEAREALAAQPPAAQFAFRTTCTWLSGSHSRNTVGGFFGLGAEQARKQEFTIDSDHPELFDSQDNAATPLEIVLSGLGSCLTAGVAAVAQYRGIQLRSVSAKLEGQIDARGMLGADPDVRNGFNDIRVTYEIDADAPREDLEALVAQSQKRSPVFDVLTNPTNVSVALG
ncbi:MAG: OsmC family protein [Myxococcales bacterium]|nr:OsmC family protein [Myxococcales bacterium]MDD9966885.1 OsmC family protein [Myxococcales bacterium]